MHLAMILAIVLPLALPELDEPPRVDLVGTSSSFSMLLEDTRVHKELGLTPDRARSCMLVAERTRNHLAAAYREARRGGSSSEAPRAPREIEAAHSREMIEEINAALTPEQLARFKQIALQSGTVATFLDPSVTRALKLDDQQKADLLAIQNEARRTIQADVRSGKLGREEIARKALQLRQEGRGKALALMSPEQKATWEALIGKPFFQDAGAPQDLNAKQIR